MKRLQSVLCALALAIALAPVALAGNIHGVTSTADGNIHGVTASGDITDLRTWGEITGLLTWGDITGVIISIL